VLSGSSPLGEDINERICDAKSEHWASRCAPFLCAIALRTYRLAVQRLKPFCYALCHAQINCVLDHAQIVPEFSTYTTATRQLFFNIYTQIIRINLHRSYRLLVGQNFNPNHKISTISGHQLYRCFLYIVFIIFIFQLIVEFFYTVQYLSCKYYTE